MSKFQCRAEESVKQCVNQFACVSVTAILGILSDPVPEIPSAALTFSIVGGTVGGLVSSVAKITESVIENQKFRDLAIAWDLFCELVQVQKTMEQADKKEEKVIAGTQFGLEVARDVIYAGVRGGAAIEPVKATVRGGTKRAAVAAGKTMHRAAKGSQKYAAAAAVGSNAVKLPGVSMCVCVCVRGGGGGGGGGGGE